MYQLIITQEVAVYISIAINVICLMFAIGCWNGVRRLLVISDEGGPVSVFLKEKSKKEKQPDHFEDMYQECWNGPTEEDRIETAGGAENG